MNEKILNRNPRWIVKWVVRHCEFFFVVGFVMLSYGVALRHDFITMVGIILTVGYLLFLLFDLLLEID